jgi:hypothetical protein
MEAQHRVQAHQYYSNVTYAQPQPLRNTLAEDNQVSVSSIAIACADLTSTRLK